MDDVVRAFPKIAACLFVLAVIGFGTIAYQSAHYNDHVATCTIDNMDRGAASDGSSHYRLYTTCGVFEDTDSLMRGKTNSADLWGRLQVGHTYQLHVAGFRFGLISAFPTVLDVVAEEPQPPAAVTEAAFPTPIR